MLIDRKQLEMVYLEEFIDKPIQEFSDEELRKGAVRVIAILEKNPIAVMDVIKNNPVINAVFLFEDLADKLKKVGSLDNLELLFNACHNELIKECVCNLSDLVRCSNALPSCADKMMKLIFASKDHVKRILEADKNPIETLKDFALRCPRYVNQFIECVLKYDIADPAVKNHIRNMHNTKLKNCLIEMTVFNQRAYLKPVMSGQKDLNGMHDEPRPKSPSRTV